MATETRPIKEPERGRASAVTPTSRAPSHWVHSRTLANDGDSSSKERTSSGSVNRRSGARVLEVAAS